jgi:hypothetical protein
MTAPTRFYVGFGLGLVTAFTVFYGVFFAQLGAPTLSSQWCWDLNARKQELARAAGTPKLLLVGGSSVLFGLSAKDIQKQTGFPTVNLGTHAALGAEYILRLAQRSAQPGDTVLLAFEYEAYQHGPPGKPSQWTDPLYFDYLFARDAAYFRSWPLTEQLRAAMWISTRRLKEGWRNRGRGDLGGHHGIYSVKMLNEYGDQTGARKDNRGPGQPWFALRSENLARGLPAEPNGFPIFRKFIEWARQNRVRVLATYPTISHRPEYEAEPAQRAAATIRAFFESQGVPVLGEAKEGMLDPDWFFDTLYHPIEEGAHERTRRLLTHLAPLLQGNKPLASAEMPGVAP